MTGKSPSSNDRTLTAVTGGIGALVAVLGALVACLAVVVRAENGFMIGVVIVAMVAVVFVEGILIGRLVVLNRRR